MDEKDPTLKKRSPPNPEYQKVCLDIMLAYGKLRKMQIQDKATLEQWEENEKAEVKVQMESD